MAKLELGDKMPNFQYETPYQKELEIAETAKKTKKTAIIFLRYYGCPMCQLDLHEMAENYQDIVSEGGQFLVVLQSDPILLKEKIGDNRFPYPIICDPEQKLYQDFEIKPAASMAKMADAKTMLKIAKVKAEGYQHGEYEGNELQLPATFVIDDNCMLTYVHYGKSISDVPGPEMIKKLIQS